MEKPCKFWLHGMDGNESDELNKHTYIYILYMTPNITKWPPPTCWSRGLFTDLLFCLMFFGFNVSTKENKHVKVFGCLCAMVLYYKMGLFVVNGVMGPQYMDLHMGTWGEISPRKWSHYNPLHITGMRGPLCNWHLLISSFGLKRTCPEIPGPDQATSLWPTRDSTFSFAHSPTLSWPFVHGRRAGPRKQFFEGRPQRELNYELLWLNEIWSSCISSRYIIDRICPISFFTCGVVQVLKKIDVII